MAQTFIAKGTSVFTNPNASTIGGAQFVRIVATSGAVEIIVQEPSAVGSGTEGRVYLHAAGDSVIIEKKPLDRVTAPTSKAHAVGSPRS